ncbi:hypothetical protein [Nesterenkonia pannonica]|uniref:hypothetical protein n=1 Tax=Nesterenkonia pannonica TaxID=1548602 RepID=UPI002164EC14|nr:hypothetical protein [Nesterenkonia pannonica]
MTTESLASLQSDLAETLRAADLKVADELFAAVDVMDTSASLRRSLTDLRGSPQSVPAVVRRLFGDKAASTTVAVLEAVASRRWSRARDLSDAVETLAVTTVAAVAERGGLHGLEELEAQLLGFRRTVSESHELQRALADGQAPDEAKQKLAARLSPQASSEARLLIDRTVTAPVVCARQRCWHASRSRWLRGSIVGLPRSPWRRASTAPTSRSFRQV